MHATTQYCETLSQSSQNLGNKCQLARPKACQFSSCSIKNRARYLLCKICELLGQVVKVIWHKAESPRTVQSYSLGGANVHLKWPNAPQCAPQSQKWLLWQCPLEPRNRLCLHRIAWPRKPTTIIKQRVATCHTTEVIVHRKPKSGCHGNVP